MSQFVNDYLTESKMKFGPFTKENRFAVEKSHLHSFLGDGFKIVEFIAIRSGRDVIFVEAKPKGFISHIAISYLESKIRELTEKFENSVDLFLSIFVGWQIDSKSEVGNQLKSADYSKIKGKCYLVINGASDDLCRDITLELQTALRRKVIIHNLDVIVINEVTAMECNLIVEVTA